MKVFYTMAYTVNKKVYRDQQIHKLQVPRKLGEKVAFFSLLQAGKHNFFTSYSRNPEHTLICSVPTLPLPHLRKILDGVA